MYYRYVSWDSAWTRRRPNDRVISTRCWSVMREQIREIFSKFTPLDICMHSLQSAAKSTPPIFHRHVLFRFSHFVATTGFTVVSRPVVRRGVPRRTLLRRRNNRLKRRNSCGRDTQGKARFTPPDNHHLTQFHSKRDETRRDATDLTQLGQSQEATAGWNGSARMLTGSHIQAECKFGSVGDKLKTAANSAYQNSH